MRKNVLHIEDWHLTDKKDVINFDDRLACLGIDNTNAFGQQPAEFFFPSNRVRSHHPKNSTY